MGFGLACKKRQPPKVVETDYSGNPMEDLSCRKGFKAVDWVFVTAGQSFDCTIATSRDSRAPHRAKGRALAGCPFLWLYKIGVGTSCSRGDGGDEYASNRKGSNFYQLLHCSATPRQWWCTRQNLFKIRRVYKLVLNFPSSTKEYFAFSLITGAFCLAIRCNPFTEASIELHCSFCSLSHVLLKYVNGFFITHYFTLLWGWILIVQSVNVFQGHVLSPKDEFDPRRTLNLLFVI